MKIKELVERLLKQDQDRIVIISKDSEGNGYSPLSEIYIGKYRPYNTWSGDIGLDELTQEDIDDGYTKEDVFEEGELCIILTPHYRIYDNYVQHHIN